MRERHLNVSEMNCEKLCLLQEVPPYQSRPSERQVTLEQLYSSDSLSDTLAFYSTLNDIADLVSFSRSRPRPILKVYGRGFESETGLVVVSLTQDIRSPLVTRLLDAYRTHAIILVESSGKFFNFAYAMNHGINFALRLRREFVLLTNDDVLPNKPLQCDLFNPNTVRADVLVPGVTLTNGPLSNTISICRQPRVVQLAYRVLGGRLAKFLPVDSRARAWASRSPVMNAGDLATYILLSGDPFIRWSARRLLERVLGFASEECLRVLNIQPISVFSSRALKGHFFDETFINGGEDLDLSIQLALDRFRFQKVAEQFTSIGGASLGSGESRVARNAVFEALYMGYKLRHVYHLM